VNATDLVTEYFLNKIHPEWEFSRKNC